MKIIKCCNFETVNFINLTVKNSPISIKLTVSKHLFKFGPILNKKPLRFSRHNFEVCTYAYYWFLIQKLPSNVGFFQTRSCLRIFGWPVYHFIVHSSRYYYISQQNISVTWSILYNLRIHYHKTINHFFLFLLVRVFTWFTYKFRGLNLKYV